DIVSAQQGVPAEKNGEICLEKRYCEENNISVGDRVEIGGNELTVTGIGSALDYDAPTKNISDASVQSKIFGIGFVTDEQYNSLKGNGKTEDLRYAYLLNGKAAHDELKETIKDFEFDIDDISDEFLLEMLEEELFYCKRCMRNEYCVPVVFVCGTVLRGYGGVLCCKRCACEQAEKDFSC
ncbi:MAG: hypothetical protein K2H90_09210, partial [Oscillospiraceae bacterium]|nr:hypothetical protein [Oscillospiraceae bacterium]